MVTSFTSSDDKVDDNKHGRRETTTDGSEGKTQKFSGSKAFCARPYMRCVELQNRRLQVRFLSHLPHFSLIFCRLERLRLRPLTAVVTAVRAFCRRQPKTQICLHAPS